MTPFEKLHRATELLITELGKESEAVKNLNITEAIDGCKKALMEPVRVCDTLDEEEARDFWNKYIHRNEYYSIGGFISRLFANQ